METIEIDLGNNPNPLPIPTGKFNNWIAKFSKRKKQGNKYDDSNESAATQISLVPETLGKADEKKGDKFSEGFEVYKQAENSKFDNLKAAAGELGGMVKDITEAQVNKSEADYEIIKMQRDTQNDSVSQVAGRVPNEIVQAQVAEAQPPNNIPGMLKEVFSKMNGWDIADDFNSIYDIYSGSISDVLISFADRVLNQDDEPRTWTDNLDTGISSAENLTAIGAKIASNPSNIARLTKASNVFGTMGNVYSVGEAGISGVNDLANAATGGGNRIDDLVSGSLKIGATSAALYFGGLALGGPVAAGAMIAAPIVGEAVKGDANLVKKADVFTEAVSNYEKAMLSAYMDPLTNMIKDYNTGQIAQEEIIEALLKQETYYAGHGLQKDELRKALSEKNPAAVDKAVKTLIDNYALSVNDKNMFIQDEFSYHYDNKDDTFSKINAKGSKYQARIDRDREIVRRYEENQEEARQLYEDYDKVRAQYGGRMWPESVRDELAARGLALNKEIGVDFDYTAGMAGYYNDFAGYAGVRKQLVNIDGYKNEALYKEHISEENQQKQEEGELLKKLFPVVRPGDTGYFYSGSKFDPEARKFINTEPPKFQGPLLSDEKGFSLFDRFDGEPVKQSIRPQFKPMVENERQEDMKKRNDIEDKLRWFEKMRRLSTFQTYHAKPTQDALGGSLKEKEEQLQIEPIPAIGSGTSLFYGSGEQPAEEWISPKLEPLFEFVPLRKTEEQDRFKDIKNPTHIYPLQEAANPAGSYDSKIPAGYITINLGGIKIEVDGSKDTQSVINAILGQVPDIANEMGEYFAKSIGQVYSNMAVS